MRPPKFEIDAMATTLAMHHRHLQHSRHVLHHYHMVPAPHIVRPLQDICCTSDASGLQQLERLEKDLEQAKQKLLVLRAQGHQEALQTENKVKFSQQRVSESRYWTNEERQRFKKALKTFGTDFAAIAKFVGTRSSTQVRTHAQKYYAKLIRDYKRSGKAQAAAAASAVKENTRIATAM